MGGCIENDRVVISGNIGYMVFCTVVYQLFDYALSINGLDLNCIPASKLLSLHPSSDTDDRH